MLVNYTQIKTGIKVVSIFSKDLLIEAACLLQFAVSELHQVTVKCEARVHYTGI